MKLRAFLEFMRKKILIWIILIEKKKKDFDEKLMKAKDILWYI